MKFRRRRRHDVSVELTPLIDVVFLLLIFFMVSTTFVRETQLKIDLPEATAEALDRAPESIVLLVSANGDYAVDDRLLINNEIDTLIRALREVSGGDQSRRIIINADAESSHQSVVRAMDAAGQLGMTKISITTQSPDPTDG